MIMRKLALLVALCLTATFLLSGCDAQQNPLDPQKPVTVTMWHHFGGMSQESMETLLDEFNNTIGRENGVIISVTSIASTKELTEKLGMIAAGDPGAPDMPDIATVYPSGAMELFQAGMLAELDNYFSNEELNAYIPQYIEEGRLSDGRLYVFPFAKSTEALFVNKTYFDRFAAATGVTSESFSSFEGIAAAAVKYYEWTDEQTPDVPNDGKAFFSADSWFNNALVGTAQMGGSFVGETRLNTDGETYRRVWDVAMPPALAGGYAVADGYTSTLSVTGDIVCSTGSTAGVTFYGDTVTFPDNTMETVEFNVLPFPVFEGGQKTALQRGTGLIVAKTERQKEYAAALFLKWFTAPEQNMRFVSRTGYLPVTPEAFEEHMTAAIQAADSRVYRTFLETAAAMHREYEFITAPNTDNLSELSADYEAALKDAMRDGRQAVLEGGAVSAVSQALLDAFLR